MTSFVTFLMDGQPITTFVNYLLERVEANAGKSGAFCLEVELHVHHDHYEDYIPEFVPISEKLEISWPLVTTGIKKLRVQNQTFVSRTKVGGCPNDSPLNYGCIQYTSVEICWDSFVDNCPCIRSRVDLNTSQDISKFSKHTQDFGTSK